MSRAIFIAAIAFAAPALAQTAYFRELSDVPLPPDFTESDTAVGFDANGGRLVMAEAIGATAPDRVRAFYMESLPALGWSYSPDEEGALVFLRGRERLSMMLRADAGRTRLRAHLVVRPASTDAD